MSCRFFFRFGGTTIQCSSCYVPIIESNFRKMVGAFDSAMPMFTRPIALSFVILAVVSVLYVLYRGWAARSHAPAEGRN